MPRVGIMLCYPFDLGRFEKWGSRALLQPKYNGERCRAIFNAEGKVTLLSSEMHQVTGVPHLINHLQKTRLKNLELDGELYTHQMDFSTIHSIVSRRVDLHPNYEAIEYKVFDLVNLKPQEERLSGLQHLKTMLPQGVEVAPTWEVNSLEEMERRLNELYDDGYEGIVLRKHGNLYRRKRSTEIMKFKPTRQDLYLVVDTKQEIDKNGKAKNTLGAFICAGEDLTLFGIGSGPLLTRDYRILLWQNREHLKGMYLRVKYQSITQANRVPLFPVALELWTEVEYEKWKATEGEEDDTSG